VDGASRFARRLRRSEPATVQRRQVDERINQVGTPPARRTSSNNSAYARSNGSAVLGRTVVSASNTSTMPMTCASSGTWSPASPSGYPLPSNRS